VIDSDAPVNEYEEDKTIAGDAYYKKDPTKKWRISWKRGNRREIPLFASRHGRKSEREEKAPARSARNDSRIVLLETRLCAVVALL
jgi:hypothetical protein